MKLSSALAAILLITPTLPAAERADSPWLKDYAEARRQARDLDRPLLVVFRCEH